VPVRGCPSGGVPVRGQSDGGHSSGVPVRGACQATLLPVSVIEFAIVVSFH
jgi:hypothetical protein